jgi:diguanylate cyclase (GGDEF)-like protein
VNSNRRSLERGTRFAALATNLSLVPAATSRRRVIFAIAILGYAVVFSSFVLFERPGLGLGHFFYIPVALLALACGTQIGFLGGSLAAALYALAIVLTPRLPTRDVLTYGTGIRFMTFSSCGILVGWFANEHRRHLEQLRTLAERDFLTGILNTRVFDEALARRCAAGRPFVLLLGDMDNLKAVNDTHGHTVGNSELRRLADALGAVVSDGDELARVGGDEFALLTDAALPDAERLCRQLCERLAAQDLHMTFGWAALPEDGVSPLELFRKADDRLYAAKLVARNHRVVQQLAGARQ